MWAAWCATHFPNSAFSRRSRCSGVEELDGPAGNDAAAGAAAAVAVAGGASEGAGTCGAPRPKVKPPEAGGAVALPNPVLGFAEPARKELALLLSTDAAGAKDFGGAAAGVPVKPLKPENGFGFAGASLPPVRPVKPPKGFEDGAVVAAGGAASGAFAELPNFFRETDIILVNNETMKVRRLRFRCVSKRRLK